MAVLPCPRRAHAPPSRRSRHDHPRLATPPVSVLGRRRRPAVNLARSSGDDAPSVLAAADANPGRPSPPPLPSPSPSRPPLPDWHPLADPPLWSGADESALGGGGSGAAPSPLASLPPAWRLLLLSDGSVTRHLQLLTGEPVEVEVLDQRLLDSPADLDGLPPSAREIAGPILQRRVLLRVVAGGDGGGSGGGATAAAATAAQHPNPALVFATSWWNVSDAAATLATTARPIWTSLASTRSELFREIRGVECGGNAALGRAFGLGGRDGGGGGGGGAQVPLWGRHYLFHRGGRPLTAIYEVFSPRLGDWLGVGGEEEGGGGGGGGRV